MKSCAFGSPLLFLDLIVGFLIKIIFSVVKILVVRSLGGELVVDKDNLLHGQNIGR